MTQDLNEASFLLAITRMRQTQGFASDRPHKLIVNPEFDASEIFRRVNRRKRISVRRWLARAALGRWVPLVALQEHSRITHRFVVRDYHPYGEAYKLMRKT